MKKIMLKTILETVPKTFAESSTKTLALLMLCLLALAGCDDPNVITAPSGTPQRAVIRFVNLTAAARTVTMQSAVGQTSNSQTANSIALRDGGVVASGVVSVSDSVAQDSVLCKLAGQSSAATKLRFLPRASNSTVFIAPRFSNNDTLLSVSLPRNPTPPTDNAPTFRFINACGNLPDTVKLSIRLGCPNGQTFVQNLLPNQISDVRSFAETQNVFSVVASVAGRDTLIGTFMLETVPLHRYSAVVYFAADTITKNHSRFAFAVMDETQFTPSLTMPRRLTEQQVFVRLVNLSSQAASGTLNGISFAAAVGTNSISAAKAIATCTSVGNDVGSVGDARALTTLEVGKSYSVIVADSAGGRKAMFVQSAESTTSIPSTKARIRLVNLAWDNTLAKRQITAILGARTVSSTLTAGTPLQTALGYGAVSSPFEVEAGTLPFIFFSNEQPQNLVGTALGSIEGGKNYLLVVTKQGNDFKPYLLPETNTPASVAPLSAGVLVQVLNAYSSDKSLRCDIRGKDTSSAIVADLRFGQNFLTVLPVGALTVNVTSPSRVMGALQLEAGKRGFIVFSGSGDRLNIAVRSTDPFRPSDNTASVRFLNAAPDVRPKFTLTPSTSIPIDSTKFTNETWKELDNDATAGKGIFEYNSFDNFNQAQQLTSERRNRLIAFSFERRQVFADVSNIGFSLRTGTTVVLAKNPASTPTHIMILLSEY